MMNEFHIFAHIAFASEIYFKSTHNFLDSRVLIPISDSALPQCTLPTVIVESKLHQHHRQVTAPMTTRHLSGHDTRMVGYSDQKPETDGQDQN